MLVLDIFLYIGIFGIIFLPYMISIILGAIIIIIIGLIRKKITKKDNKFTVVIYAIIITFCIVVSKNLGYSVTKYLSAKPDRVYTEMKEINDSKRLIGLSKEQVIQLLGKPRGKEEKDVYYYDAGKITDYLFFGERDFYELRIIFDENDKVKDTLIKEVV